MRLRSYKERTGFGKWSTILVYKCQCGHENKIRKNWQGSAPKGGFECTSQKCNEIIKI